MKTWDVTVAIIVDAETEKDASEQVELECAAMNATILDVEEVISERDGVLVQKVIIRSRPKSLAVKR